MPLVLPTYFFFFFNDTATTEIYTLSYTTLFRSPAARQVLAAARRLAIPVVLFTRQNVDLELGWWARWQHRRMLRRLTGLVAGSDLAGSLARHYAPNLPIAVIPQLGALAPHVPLHVPHEGLAI